MVVMKIKFVLFALKIEGNKFFLLSMSMEVFFSKCSLLKLYLDSGDFLNDFSFLSKFESYQLDMFVNFIIYSITRKYMCFNCLNTLRLKQSY